jgi:predicted ATPase/DNA-binding SARP family transcriptional activator/Tfp pilus assembly protein PilF
MTRARTHWSIHLLGELRASDGEREIAHFRTQRTALLLASLAYHPGRAHSRSELAEMLWPEAAPEAGRHSLSMALAWLRQQLEPPGVPSGHVLIANRASIRLNPDVVATDVVAFEAALQAAARAGDETERMTLLAQAVERYTGELLPGVFEDWILQERQWLAESYFQALGELVAHLERRGEIAQAVEAARRGVRVDPLREEAHRDLIRLLTAAGQPEAAARQYRSLEQLLEKHLGAEPSPETRALVAPLDATPRVQPPEPAPPTAAVPLPLNRFFGRTNEIARLRELLLNENVPARLVTLTGPGGCGKTRLAIEIATRLRGAWSGAIWFVRLAEVVDAWRLLDAVQDALQLPRTHGLDPLDPIVTALSLQPSFLVLDNFEQLLPDGVPLVQTLLERVETLTILVTSRRRLGVPGEHPFPVPPLPWPGELDAPERLLECASARLFVDRARAARPEFAVTPANATAVARLCAQLEGLPLAIELAAARVAVLTPAQMVTRLGGAPHTSSLLARPTGEERHRSLKATLDWSYQLLEPSLQQFFVRLSIFRGGWTLEAAESVGEDPLALDRLAELKECSLVVTEEHAGEIRFRMLETLRQYAGEQLSPEEAARARARHAAFYLALAEAPTPDLQRTEAVSRVERLEREHDNLRAAMEWFVEQRDVAAALRLGTLLAPFWATRGYWREGSERLEEALALPSAQARTVARAEALVEVGNLAREQGKYGAARRFHGESLSIYRELGDRPGIALALHCLGTVAYVSGEYDAAHRLHEESLALQRELGDRYGIALSHRNLGQVAHRQGNLAIARSHLEESLAIVRALDRWPDTATLLQHLGRLAVTQGEYETAEARLQESLAKSREMGAKQGICGSLVGLGDVAVARAEHGAARSFYEESLEIARELGDRSSIAWSSRALGTVDRLQGNSAAARALYEESLAICRELGNQRLIADSLHGLGLIASDQGDDEAAQRLLQESLAIQQALGNRLERATILRGLAEVDRRLGGEESAWRRYEESLSIARELEDRPGIAGSLCGLGALALQRDDPQAARALLDESLAIFRRLTHHRGITQARMGLAAVALSEGEHRRAGSLYRECLATLRKAEERPLIAYTLEGLATVAAREGNAARAVRWLGAAAALRETLGIPVPLALRTRQEAERPALCAALGEAPFTAAWDAGRALTWEAAADEALASNPPAAGAPPSSADRSGCPTRGERG